MSRKVKYRLALDTTAKIECFFNAGISIMKNIPIPELNIIDEESANGKFFGLYQQRKNIVVIVNGSGASIVYHELSHCIYGKVMNIHLVPENYLVRHDVIFACIYISFFVFIGRIRNNKNNKFPCLNNYRLNPLQVNLYDVHEETEPLLQGSRGIFFVERFFSVLNSPKKYYETESVEPEMVDIPLIAYTAKQLVLASVSTNMDTYNPIDCFPYLTQVNIDESIEKAIEICMFQKNCCAKNKEGVPLRPKIFHN